jgi:hypothetical protein
MPKIMAIPNLTATALKNQIGGKDARPAVGADSEVAHTSVETTGTEGSQDHIHLLCLVAFCRLQEFEKKGSSERAGQSP